MAISYTVTRKITTPSGTLTQSTAYSASASTELDETVADSQTDYQIAVAIDVSAVKAFWIESDQAVTVETNSGSSPTNTLTLVAGVPYVWNTDWYDTFKLTGDVTNIFVTNASGSTANIKLRVVQDATP